VWLDWQHPRGWWRLWWKAAETGRAPGMVSRRASPPVRGTEVLSPFVFTGKTGACCSDTFAGLICVLSGVTLPLVSAGAKGCGQQGRGGP